MIRLDKYLADMEVGTRSEVKKHIRKGCASINGEVIKKPEHKVLEDDLVTFLGEEIIYTKEIYLMLNKPNGVVSATRDNYDTTVLELLDEINTKNLFPVGRLDKDTEGLIIITNDGALSHRLLSPKRHVDKVYFANIEGKVTQEDVDAFKEGLEIGEKNPTLPANLEIIESGETSVVNITIQEGKFHQIKRMFHAVDKDVIYLKRVSMGPIILDETLELGEYRPLTEEELKLLDVI